MTIQLTQAPQLCFPVIKPSLMLAAPKVDAEKPPRKRKAKPTPEPPKKFNGKIKLYWQEFNAKPDIILEIQSPEIYSIFEILHGMYHMENIERWQENPVFTEFYGEIWEKAQAYADRLKRLRRLKVESWDWDWVD